MNSFICQLSLTSLEDLTYEYKETKFCDDLSYTILWSGEIYNITELKKKAVKLGFSEFDESIEQLIIFLFDTYGTKVFSHLNGKFSIVIWDKNQKTLYGARDPFGIESLYYYEGIDQFYVTNLKSYLEQTRNFKKRINHQALQHYLTFQYVPDPLTMTEGCFKLRAGHFFIKTLKEPMQQFAYFKPQITPMINSRQGKIKEIQKALYESVSERISGKEKVGSFLSGGIDSTIITSIAKDLHPNLKVYTIDYPETEFSEMKLAEKTASILELDHQKIVVTPKKYVQALVTMIYQLEDPLADPSAVPLFIGYLEASKSVDMMLSGEGADEMFGGYEIYREYQALRLFNFLPKVFKKPLHYLANLLPKGVKGKNFLQRGLTPLENRYVGNAKIFEEYEKKQLLYNYCSKNQTKTFMKQYFADVMNKHPVEKMQYVDWQTWLPGDILFKANRLSQAAHINLQLPFIDQRIYKIAKNLTIDEKISHRTTKVILRNAATGIVPEYMLREKKRGFPVPLRKWLREELAH